MKSFSLVYIAVCIHMYVQTCIRESFKTSLPFWSLLGQPMFSLLQPGSPNLRRSQPITLNHYATKKSVAESMLDVAFFMSNAMRLKAVLEQGPSSHYYTTLVTLISISLLLQVVTGILLVVIGESPGQESASVAPGGKKGPNCLPAPSCSCTCQLLNHTLTCGRW